MKPQILRTNITSRLYNPLNGPAVSGRTWRHSLSPESKHFYCQMTTNTHGVQMVIFRMLLCFFHPVFIRPYPLPHCIFFFHSASSSCSASPTALTGFSASILFPLGPSFQGTELCFLLPHRSSRAFLWVGRKDFISELAKSRPLDQNKSTNTFYFCLHNVLISFN